MDKATFERLRMLAAACQTPVADAVRTLSYADADDWLRCAAKRSLAGRKGASDAA